MGRENHVSSLVRLVLAESLKIRPQLIVVVGVVIVVNLINKIVPGLDWVLFCFRNK